MKVEKIDSPRISVITFGDNSITVSNQVRQTIPPRTGRLFPATLDKTFVGKPTDSIFSFKNAIIHKINKLNNKLHPGQDESYLGLNSIDQAVLVSDSNDVENYFFNESFSRVTISSNCVIGSISVPEHHPAVVDMTSVLTIAPDCFSESLWMNNVPSAELSRKAHAHKREHVHQVLDISNNPTLLKHLDIAGQLFDLIMIFLDVFYRDGNCGGTDVIEHPVYAPKGLPPIRLKNRPVNPGPTDSLKEQIATWLKDGVIR